MAPTFKKVPDGPWDKDRRPSKETIATLEIKTERSETEHHGKWSLEDDVRLIRAKEKDDLDWSAIKELFPNRKGYAVQRRYHRNLVESKGDDNISDDIEKEMHEDVPTKRGVSHVTPGFLPEAKKLKVEGSIMASLSKLPPKAVLKPKPKKKTPRQSSSKFDEETKTSIAAATIEAPKKRGVGTLRCSLRPSKYEIETLVISSEKSNAQNTDTWSRIDDIRLIRLKECLNLRWLQIDEYFPGRQHDAAEKRYTFYLRKGENDPAISVPEQLLYFGKMEGPSKSLFDFLQDGIVENQPRISEVNSKGSLFKEVVQRCGEVPHVDSFRQRIMTIIDVLQESQLNKRFTHQKIISLQTLIAEVEYEDAFPTTDEHPTLPCVLQPSIEVYESTESDRTPVLTCRAFKLFVHDDISMIIGISRVSSAPHKSIFAESVKQYHERSRKYVQFYLDRCHVGKHDNCCQPSRESVVIIGSSNTDFSSSNINSIHELQRLLEKVKPREKAILVFSQTDSICTNILRFEAFLRPFLDRDVDIELVVWWSNDKFFIYDARKVFSQLLSKQLGRTLDPYYQKFLTSLAHVATNKEVQAKASRSNKHEGLGRRNSNYIDARDYLISRELADDSEALLEPSRPKDIVLSRTAEGLFQSPIDDETFATSDEVAKYIVDLEMCKLLNERSCPFCSYKCSRTHKSGYLLQHVAAHIFERLECPEQDCNHVSKGTRNLRSHMEYKHSSRLTPCPYEGCKFVLRQCQISKHVRTAHVRSQQVTLFGKMMGIGEWIFDSPKSDS